MNKVMLIGNVGKDPVVRYYDADQAVAQVTFATTEKGYKLPNGTQVPDHTDWHNLVFYRSLAKVVEKYVHKGDKLYVEGKIRYRLYDDAKGQRRHLTEIYVDNMEMLTPKSVSNQSSPTGSSSASVSSSEATTVETQNKLPF